MINLIAEWRHCAQSVHQNLGATTMSTYKIDPKTKDAKISSADDPTNSPRKRHTHG